MDLKKTIKLANEYKAWEAKFDGTKSVAWVDKRKAARYDLRDHAERHFQKVVEALEELRELIDDLPIRDNSVVNHVDEVLKRIKII